MGHSLAKEKSRDILSQNSICNTNFPRSIERESISPSNLQYESRPVPFLSLDKPSKENQPFRWVRSISVDEGGRVFAVSPFSSSICVFTQEGVFLFDFKNGVFSPWKVCVCGDAVFVTDSSSLAKFTLSGEFAGKWRKGLGSRSSGPFYGLDCDKECRVYAVDSDSFVYVFAFDCELITHFKIPLLKAPCDLAVSGRGDLLLTDMKSSSFVFWGIEDQFPYKSPFRLRSDGVPTAIFCCFDSQHNILLTDPFTNCIRIYSPSFDPLHTLNENNCTPSFVRPYGITVTSSGLILCACDSDPYFYIF